MHQTQLQGEFYVDDTLIYSGLFPQISFVHGLTLYRMAIQNEEVSEVPDGPHLSFPFFHPYLLTTSHSLDEMRSGPQYRFQGTRVGSIFKTGGYLYGYSNIRRVTNISLSLSFAKESLLIRVAGEAGSIIPGNGLGTDRLSFNFWFSLSIDDVIKVAPEIGEEGLKNLISKLKSL